MPFVLVFRAHPALEVPFASVWPMLRAGAVRIKVGGFGFLESGKGGGGPWFG